MKMKILETIGLTKGFDGLVALDQLDFKLEAGEIRAVIGPNGVGKTTFLNLITGQLRPTAGKIFFKGEEITGLPPYAIARLGIARTFQITSLFSDLTICQNIWGAVAVQGVRGRGRRWRWLYPSSHLTDVHKRTAEILELVGLLDKADALASELSHGEQKLLELGIALSAEPELLLLDEPTAGLSPLETKQMIQLIKELELSMIIVEHDMQVVMELAASITVLHYGRVLAEGRPQEIRENKHVQEVYLRGAR